MTDDAKDPVARLIEQQLGGEPGTDPLDELTRANPQLGLLARVLMHRESDQPSDDERFAELRMRTESLKRRFNEVIQEADDAVTRLGVLADALGACPECWGEDPDCRWCHGRGRPGFAAPEPTFFDSLVLPAVRTAARLRRANGPGRTDDHHSAEQVKE